jgi:hypothetical protein
MDPYIEAQGNWQDFHNSLIGELRNALGVRLPEDYAARVDERIEVVGFDDDAGTAYRPDVLVAWRDRPEGAGRTATLAPASAATLEPVLMEVADHDPEEIRHTWLEVRKLPDFELVTVVEVLSPVNKSGLSRQLYLDKRKDPHDRKINLVEIDVLLDGLRVPMKRPLNEGHYFAIVARGPKLPQAEVYCRSVRDRLPVLPIPLREPDPDVPIDLQELVDIVYDTGRYGRTLRHDLPLPEGLPLHPEDRSWAEGFSDAHR